MGDKKRREGEKTMVDLEISTSNSDKKLPLNSLELLKTSRPMNGTPRWQSTSLRNTLRYKQTNRRNVKLLSTLRSVNNTCNTT